MVSSLLFTLIPLNLICIQGEESRAAEKTHLTADVSHKTRMFHCHYATVIYITYLLSSESGTLQILGHT